MESTTAQPPDLQYGAGTPWPDIARAQIEELQRAMAAQTAELNRLVDRLEYVEGTLRHFMDRMEGD